MKTDYERVERAIHYIRQNVGQQPDLKEVAAHVGLSPYHFQRLFQRWAGVTPKRFLEYLTVEQAKILLEEQHHHQLRENRQVKFLGLIRQEELNLIAGLCQLDLMVTILVLIEIVDSRL